MTMKVTPADFELVRKLLHKHTGITIAKGKEYLVETRFTPLAQDWGFANLHALVLAFQQRTNMELYRCAVDALTTNETQFFRDAHPFETLKTTILPELIKKRSSTQSLKLWSAASSTGQEAYSVAMLLDEYFPQLQQWQVYLMGSDLSTEALEQAREGRYRSVDVNRGLPARLLVKYFRQQGNDWCIADHIRERVEFRSINLASKRYDVPRMDIIFLRNVLIYFDTEMKQNVLRRLRRLLQPDGYLFLGSTETLFHLDTPFRPVRFEKTNCYQLRH